MANKIYIPDYTPQKYPCVVYSNAYLTAYREMPRANTYVAFDRFYQSDHYNSVTQAQQFGNTVNVTCLPSNQLTSDFYYRNDLADILLVFAIIAVVGFGIPFKLIMKLVKRGRL